MYQGSPTGRESTCVGVTTTDYTHHKKHRMVVLCTKNGVETSQLRLAFLGAEAHRVAFHCPLVVGYGSSSCFVNTLSHSLVFYLSVLVLCCVVLVKHSTLGKLYGKRFVGCTILVSLGHR